MFNSIINCKVALQVVAPFFSLITRNEYFCCYLCQYLLSWVIMEFSHSNRCIVYLLVVVICISLRTNNVLRKYILFSCVDLPSFLVKYLFMMTQGLLLCSAVWVPLRIPQAPYPCVLAIRHCICIKCSGHSHLLHSGETARLSLQPLFKICHFHYEILPEFLK